jgi:N-terminal acetyltransferase B complex catalytic subunit
MGKLESSPSYYASSPHYLPHHAHITALTVAPSSRRLGLARVLSSLISSAGDTYNAYFVDLFVRKSNIIAQQLYRGLGYSVFRVVKNYYSDDPSDPQADGEDAYDMRKPCKRDVLLKHARKNGELFEVQPDDVW